MRVLVEKLTNENKVIDSLDGEYNGYSQAVYAALREFFPEAFPDDFVWKVHDSLEPVKRDLIAGVVEAPLGTGKIRVTIEP